MKFLLLTALLSAIASSAHAGIIYSSPAATTLAFGGTAEITTQESNLLEFEGGFSNILDNAPSSFVSGNLQVNEAVDYELSMAVSAITSGSDVLADVSFRGVDTLSVAATQDSSSLSDAASFTGELLPGTDYDFLGATGSLGFEGDGSGFYSFSLSVTPQSISNPGGVVPEPASLAIFGVGALGLVAGGRRRHKRKQAA